MKYSLLFLFGLLFTFSPGALAESLSGKRPNILFLLTDDQGYGDISAHGNPVLKTPNLDKLRSEGLRFTDFHVSPTCSPTRSALMTGRHEFKNGITHTILERERLTLKATTLAQVLKSAGYTTGIFGKWHLGDEAEYQPNRRGFDEVFIHGGGGIGQICPGSCGDAPGNKYFDPAILHNGKFEKTKGYCTDLFYAQATKWIDSQRQSNKPFFAYTRAPWALRLGLYYELLDHNARTEDFIHFVREVHGHLRRPVILVWDRLPAHRSAAQRLLEDGAAWLRVEWLPPYAPDLDPVEDVWNQAKYGALANVIPEDIHDLHSALDHALDTFRHEPNRLHSFFDAAHLIL